MDDRSSTSSTTNNKPATPSINENKPATTARPSYSSKLSDQFKPRVAAPTFEKAVDSSTSGSNNKRPSPPQRAWTGAKNPITGRSQTPQGASSPQNKHSVTGALRENQRVRFTLLNGAEYEGTYANNAANPDSCYLKMVQQKKGQNGVEVRNGAQTEGNMSFQRNQIAQARPVPNHTERPNDRAYNGNLQKFRTDTAISSGALGQERQLTPWKDDDPVLGGLDDGLGGLESQSGGRGQWDQFAVAKEKFGMTTDYDENIYTTAINKNAPDYQKRLAIAERKAREIESSTAMTSHVAEERQADYKQGNAADDGADEEDKYSGVRRQDFPPLQSRENKYTPPARRAPTGNSTVRGAPVDPAIISSQLKAPSTFQKPTTPKAEENKAPLAPAKATDTKPEAKVVEPKGTPASGDGTVEKNGTSSLRPAVTTTTTRAVSSSQATQPGGAAAAAASVNAAKAGIAPTNADSVQRDVAKEFKEFAAKERKHVALQRTQRVKVDHAVKLQELKKFSLDFKLNTPVPEDIVSIIAKDPVKQKEIQEKALRDAAEVKARAAQQLDAQKEKAASPVATKDKPTKTLAPVQPAASTGPSAGTATTPGQSTAGVSSMESRNNNTVRPTAPQHNSSPSAPGRQAGPRQQQQYPPQSQYQQHQSYRGNHQGQHMGGRGGLQTGNLAQRIREQHKMNPQQQQHQPQHLGQQMGSHLHVDMRIPPTGPANNGEPYQRRLSGLAPSHLQQPKLNPNTQEFRPNAFAPAFNPAGPSQGSSPRAAINSTVNATPAIVPPPSGGKLNKRQTKAVDPTKCNILEHLRAVTPKAPNKNWEDNDGIQPCFATNPTWRYIEDEDKERERNPNSTMLITYQEYFAQQPRRLPAASTPRSQHTMAGTTAHLHQLPPHLQHAHSTMAQGQSPRMPPMQMHTPQQGHLPHAPYQPNPDDHRMMQSNSAQSFASPRVTPQMPMAYGPNMGSPAPIPYNQPVMQQQYMNPGAPQMNPQFRSFSNNGNPQFIPPQAQHMGGPGQPQFMMQQPGHFMPNGMVPGPGPMPMYPGAPQYMQPPGTGPPPSIAGSNGYPSPGRPAAPMMAHQGSYQGQQMGYGMSPGIPYQQTFVPQPQPHQHQPNKYPQRPQ